MSPVSRSMQLPTAAELLDGAARLYDVAEFSRANRQIEADLRSDLNTVLQPFAFDVLRIPMSDIRQEGTGISGRFDSMFGSAIVEYKRPGLLASPAERRAAAQQSLGYLDAHDLGATVVILTDGATWGILRDVEAGPEAGEQSWMDFGLEDVELAPDQRFAWRGNSPETTQRVLSLISTVRAAPVSSNSLTARMGVQRPEVIDLVTALANQIRNRRTDSRADVLYRQWVQLAGVAYGIKSPDDEWPATPSVVLADTPRLAEALAPLHYPEALFILHTYVSIASKLVAAETLALVAQDQELRPTQWTSLDDRRFAARIRELETGHLTDALRAPDLLAGDLFTWYVGDLDSAHETADALRAVTYALSELAWARVANAGGVAVDLLRDLYHSVVPRSMRKSLGEFFTPRWLAERVLDEGFSQYWSQNSDQEEGSRILTVLDPACGSGTFLVAALRKGLAQLARQGKADDADAVHELVESLVGFDINPVSPLMTRVNLLLALGDRAELLPEIRLKVYEADSILLPEKRTGQLSIGASSDVLEVSLYVDDFAIPAPLASLEGMAILRENIERGVENDRSAPVFKSRLSSGLVQKLGIHLESELLELCVSGYQKMKELHDSDRDGIWARVLEQAMAPALMQPVDLVVGNPPWISWKDLPDAWKRRSQKTWEQWGLWQQRERGSGIPLSDISTLMTARVLASYVADTGIVALLLPQSTVKADPSGRAFRRCHLADGSNITYDPGQRSRHVSFSPLHIDDFSEINPFSPDASNFTIALYLRRGVLPQFPISQTTWRRAQARQKLSSTSSWTEVEPLLQGETVDAGPVDPGDAASPWVPIARDGELTLLDSRDIRALSWGRGFETRGLDGYFFVEVRTPAPVGRTRRVAVQNRPDLGKNTKNEAARSGTVESALIWPLIKGENVQPWRVTASGLYCIVAHDPDHPSRVLSTKQMISQYPQLYDYLEPWIERMSSRSLYRAAADEKRPWALSGPMQHLDKSKPYVAVRYIATGGVPAAAVCEPAMVPELGRVTVPLPNNKTNIIFTATADEAYYLAAWVNSTACGQGLARFAVSTGITPKALSRLPIPTFDSASADHQSLVALARDCTAAAVHAPVSLDALTAEIDAIVRRLALKPV